jgi:Ca-activated chloride channel family protein
VYVTFDGTHSLVELAADPVGDRPIEIGFALGLSDAPSLAAFVAPAVDGEREVVVVLSPALETAAETVRPKELLFLLDTSGSMHGEKIAKATHALGTCLERTAPADRFNLARFSHDFELLHAEPVPGTAEAVAAARLWLERQRTGGNTRLSPALEATLEQAHDATLHRLVVIVSDGKLGDAPEVQALLQARLGEARLFLVGIGDDVNEPEILRLAQLGRGTAVFARAAEQLEAAITELFGGIAAPVAWDLRLHWGEAEVVSMEPSHVPDLYAGRPVTIRARVRGELPPDLLVEASTMDGVRVFQTALPAGGAAEFDQLERRAD